MIIEYLPTKNGMSSWSQIKFRCDDCSSEFTRRKTYDDKVRKNPLYDRDYCRKCWQALRNRQPQYRKNMSESLKKMRQEHPELAQRISATSKKLRINAGNKNAMKRSEVVEKMKISRNIMLSDPAIRKSISQKTKKAWEDGKFDGVAVGRCKWYDYISSSGEIYKVQGTWELAFIQWLDEKKMTFRCHRGRIPYSLDGKSKNYYPDFWVDEWQSHVDVKADYFYSESKTTAIRECNPNLQFRILKKSDLLSLGVKI